MWIVNETMVFSLYAELFKGVNSERGPKRGLSHMFLCSELIIFISSVLNYRYTFEPLAGTQPKRGLSQVG